jgi:hypothetical protein
MSVALIMQSIAMSIRSVLFFLLALLRPLDMIADLFQRLAYWLAVDGHMTTLGIQYREDTIEREKND